MTRQMEEVTNLTSAVAPPIDIDRPRPARVAASAIRAQWADLLTVLIATAQLGLLVFVIKLYRIEARTFRVTFAIACCGFLVHHFLPQRFKLSFFTILSLVAMAATLGVVNTTLIVATGLILIGLCHLPVSWTWRVVALLAAAGVLAAVRLELFNIPQFSAVITILGAIFMFRLIVYAYDVRNGVPSDFWRATAYFFMLPNACFPLFPIVDYQKFVRTAHEGSRAMVYQTGLHYIFRGIIHLLLLRYLNSVLRVDVNSIASAGDLFKYMILAFSGYLNVSGTFHIIVGMLHLFEFNLPESHHNYLLSSSFTDLWRRINIYWKDFIQKIVFYPIYFRLKALGPVRAVVLATAIAMVITWAFHSYQWFWLKGVWLISPSDIAFWVVLGLLLTINTWYETRYSRQRAIGKLDQSLKSSVILGIKTSATMTVLLVLWSMWTTDSLSVWFGIMKKGANCSAGELAVILGVLSLPGIIAAIMPPPGREGPKLASPTGEVDWRWLLPRSGLVMAGATALLVLAQPAVQTRLGADVASLANKLVTPRMSQQGNTALEQGYYDNLTNAALLNPELAQLYAQTPLDWPGENPVRPTKSWMIFEVTPSKTFKYYRKTVTTNRWGMRDREYELAKPPGTFRVGLFGESHTFGNGVEGHETYKQLAEDGINESGLAPAGQRVQIMNFSTPGYGPIFKLASLEQKGFQFDLDVAIQTAVSNEKGWAVNNLTGAVIEGTPIPYEFLSEIVAKAGVNNSMTPQVINYRLSPYADDLIRWTYARLAEACRKHNVRPYLLLLPKPEYEIGRDKAVAELTEIAQSEGIGVLDITDAYDVVGDLQSMWVAPWDNHPDARGHRLLADAILRELQGQIGSELLSSPARAPRDLPK